MSQLYKYSAYKDSGLVWLGEIPEHWELKPIKYLKKNIKNAFVDGPFGSSLKTEHFIQNGDVYVVESGFITTGKFKFKEFKTITEKHFKTIQRSSCTKDDVIIAKIGANYGMAGELPKLDKKSVISGNSLKITLNNRVILSSIFVKLLESVKRLGGYNGIVNISAQPALSLGTLNNLRLPLPPKKEQTQIATYLDQKTSQIDQAITQKENLIVLLKEQKQITINEAVTKGLDKNVTLKDSGVEWIGEIPEHWDVIRSKRLFQQRKDRARKGDKQLTASQKYGVIYQDKFMELEGRKVTQVEYNHEILKRAEAGDFLISMRSFQGGIEYCRNTGSVSSAYVALIPIKHVIPEYFKYLFKSQKYITALSSTSNLVRDGQALRFDNFSMVDLLVIPKEEQKQISEYLDKQTSKIDKAINLQQNYISKLKEYKASLIDSVVTGKVKVAS